MNVDSSIKLAKEVFSEKWIYQQQFIKLINYAVIFRTVDSICVYIEANKNKMKIKGENV